MSAPIHTIDDLRGRLLVSCSESDVGLWWVAADVEEFLGSEEFEPVRSTAIEVLTPLLRNGLIQPFTILNDGTFQDWHDQPDEAIRRIDEQWRVLGRRPQQNEIVWFTATDRGRNHIDNAGLRGRW
jgi:hypothetical protein